MLSSLPHTHVQLAKSNLTLMGDTAGYGEESEQTNEMLAGAARLCSDVVEIRKRKAAAMAGHKDLVEQLNRLRQQTEAAEKELKEMWRENAKAVRAKKTGVGRKRLDAVRKLEYLAIRRKELEISVDELRGQQHSTSESTNRAAKAVQDLSVIKNERTAMLVTTKVKLKELATRRDIQMYKYRKRSRQANAEKDELLGIVAEGEERLFMLKKEQERAASWTSKWFDTAIWQKGVLQRIKTSELRTFIEK